MGSAHDQPNSELSSRPASRTPDRYVHSRVCLESATALAEPSSRPARRCAYDRNGITTSDTAASTIPTVEWSAASTPSSARTDSTVMYAASAKNDTAMILSAMRSRASGLGPENCHATAAADATSMTESSPNPIKAVDVATVPADIATTASIML